MADKAAEKVPHWEGDEFVSYGMAGRELRLPYEMYDHCNFRATEISDFVWTFRISDVLSQGRITTKEARIALRRIGEEPTDTEWLRVINAVDKNSTGLLYFQQFVKLVANFNRSEPTEDELTQAFTIFDRDKSGSIDAVELRDVLKKLGFPITPLEAHSMIAEADDDGSGEVTYTEFVTKILQAR
mmetsp:Transcript_9760/g.17229  ORF Transcript_9760/g.17229 Transcript_9760/m.17229 type:complete len:185 (+) Transcript_9760:68-622(+)